MKVHAQSCFSGVGGFDLAAERLGIEITSMSEIDKNCRTVLTEHFTAPITPDVKDVQGDTTTDLVFGGWPCQDISSGFFSRKHGRLGLNGDRSGLFWEFVRILDESKSPWFVFENVPGLLRSNEGRDMDAFVTSLADLGYGISYRVLDVRDFGLPQARKRLIAVGHLGSDGSGPERVLHLPQGGTGSAGADGTPGGFRSVGTEGRSGGVLTYRKSRRAQSTTDHETWVLDTYTNTLTGFDSGDVRTTTLIVDQNDNSVRRLTPVEDERLQGLPDNWTEMVPESARRKQMGNAMNVAMAEFVFAGVLREMEAA